MLSHCLPAWEGVSQTGLAELQDACNEARELLVLDDHLWSPTLCNPESDHAMQLVSLLVSKHRQRLVLLCCQHILNHACSRLDLARGENVSPLVGVVLLKMKTMSTRARALARPFATNASFVLSVGVGACTCSS